MPLGMKIQPIDFNTLDEVAPPRLETVKPVMKSRLKRLFERQFPSVLKNSATEKDADADELPFNKECAAEFEPSSVCLAKMVQNFIEENNEKQRSGAVRCSRNRCHCFNRNCSEGSEYEMDGFGDPNLTSSGEASGVLKSLVSCASASEFEIARSTKTYKSIIQALPFIFVGKADRLQKIIAIISEAVKQSLKKKGMHIPPWRKAEYVKAKWLSPHNRTTPSPSPTPTPTPTPTIEAPKEFEFEAVAKEKSQPLFELNPEEEEKNSVEDSELGESIFALSGIFEEGKEKAENEEWKPPEIKPKNSLSAAKIVTGLASVIEDD
ncbi:hypothetical protein F3Y22_tig00111101pilonHSYRG00010 [Hibiscus syriacus]|uniref:Uncharacterized protein n=1 Tax=Hibiscus syriacus TaxID=106335 RepID=A0A6A2Z0F8_HIBSY|nr:hypothetical protein F3Y22_tig00111101pilonHSYRG00010 [Hibiscus syriacus]